MRLYLLFILAISISNVSAQQSIFDKKTALPGALTECSGIEYTDGRFWTFNDGGHPAVLYQIDSSSGAVLQQVTVTNYGNTDWEDITSDSDYIYIGDFGNNNGTRADLKVLKITKADIGSGPAINVSAQAINYSYPDQTSFITNDKNDFDCESLIALGDSLYIFTKNSGNFQSRLYSLPKTPGTYSAHLISQYDVVGKITAAAINPSRNQVALLGYSSNHYGTFILLLSDYKGNDFFSGIKKRVRVIDYNIDWQTEGITYFTDYRLFLTCETSSQFVAQLYAADLDVLNSHVLSANQVTDKAKNPIIVPNPSGGDVYIDPELCATGYTLYNPQGEVVCSGNLQYADAPIDFSCYAAGLYLIEVKTAAGSYFEHIFLKK